MRTLGSRPKNSSSRIQCRQTHEFELITHGSTGDFCYRKSIELGYRRIYLIGIEGEYVEEIAECRPLTKAEAEELGFASLRKRKNLRIITSTPKSNPNYFFDDYQQEGDVYSLPEAAGHRDRWATSARFATYHGVRTWNLSHLSALKCFPKRDVSTLFDETAGQKLDKLGFVILLNPTLRTDVEHTFWRNFCSELVRRGYLPVIFIAKAPSNVDVVPVQEALYSGEMVWQPEEACRSEELAALTENFQSKHCDVAATIASFASKKHIRHLEDLTIRGLKNLSAYMEYILTKLQPCAVVVNNDTNIPAYLFSSLSRRLGIATFHSERSPSTSQWFEPEGFYALSALDMDEANTLTEASKFLKIGREVIAQLNQDPTAHRGREADPLRGSIKSALAPEVLVRSPRPRRIFLPLDEVVSTGWTPPGHPLKTLNYPLFGSPSEAIARLAAVAEELQAVLVVKPHPNQVRRKFFKGVSFPENVELYTGDLKSVLEVSDVVVCFLTKVAFSALAMGKPVVTLAPNVAARSGLTFHCRHESDVADQVRAAFDYEWSGTQRAKVAAFLGYLESEYFLNEELSNNGAQNLLNKAFPQRALPDEEIIEEARLFVASIDHFNAEASVALPWLQKQRQTWSSPEKRQASAGGVEELKSGEPPRAKNLFGFVLQVLRRRPLIWLGWIAVFLVLTFAPAVPALWSQRNLFWMLGGLVAVCGLGLMFAALAREIFGKVMQSREAVLAGFTTQSDVATFRRALNARSLSENRKFVLLVAFQLSQGILRISGALRRYAVAALLLLATIAALALAPVAYEPFWPYQSVFWGLSGFLLLLAAAGVLISLIMRVVRTRLITPLKEAKAQLKGANMRLELAAHKLGAVSSRLAKLEEANCALEARLEKVQMSRVRENGLPEGKRSISVGSDVGETP